jgi:hypothetical protein
VSFDAQFLSGLMTAIYDAALDESLWPAALEKICTFVSGPAAMIFAHDGTLRSGQRFFSWGDDPEYTRLYFERYAKISPFTPAQNLLDVGEVRAALDLVPWSEFVETRFYREWAAPQGYVDNIFAIIDKSQTSFAALAVTRDTQSGVVDNGARQRMNLVTPHVRRAVMIGNVIDLRKAEATMLAEMVADLASAVFFVAADAKIVFANKTGEDLLSKGTVLRRAGWSLRATNMEADAALKSVFAAAANGDAAVGTKGVAVLLSTSPEDSLACPCPAVDFRSARVGADHICGDRRGVRAQGIA